MVNISQSSDSKYYNIVFIINLLIIVKRALNILRDIVLLTCFLSFFSVLGKQASQPWLLGLDVEKGVTYFDESGRQLSRTKLLCQAKIEDCSGLEIGDFDKKRSWFELILLRDDFYFDVFPLPKPGEKSVRRYDYYRYRAPADHEATALAYVNYPKDESKYAFLVNGMEDKKQILERLFLFEQLNTEDRSQVQVMTITPDWSDFPSVVELATLGYKSSLFNLAAVEGSRLYLAKMSSDGSALTKLISTELREGIKPIQLRLNFNSVYLLDDSNRIHHWVILNEETLSMGKTVILKIPIEVKSFALLSR